MLLVITQKAMYLTVLYHAELVTGLNDTKYFNLVLFASAKSVQHLGERVGVVNAVRTRCPGGDVMLTQDSAALYKWKKNSILC